MSLPIHARIVAVAVCGAVLRFTPEAHAMPTEFNGHFYEVIFAQQVVIPPVIGKDGVPVISWNTSNAAASTLSFMGATGHLATITSEEEDDFLKDLAQNTPGAFSNPITGGFGSFTLGPWIGGFFDTNTGLYTWVNNEGTIPVTNGTSIYAGWIGNEPNSPDEHHLVYVDVNLSFQTPNGNGLGWGDCDNICFRNVPSARIRSFIVEYDVPEPAALAFFGFGLAGLGYMRRRRAA